MISPRFRNIGGFEVSNFHFLFFAFLSFIFTESKNLKTYLINSTFQKTMLFNFFAISTTGVPLEPN